MNSIRKPGRTKASKRARSSSAWRTTGRERTRFLGKGMWSICEGLPGGVEGDGVEELECGVDLAVGLVGEVLDLDAVQEESADVVFAEVGRGAPVEGRKLAAVEKVVASSGRAEVAQDKVLGHAVVQ